MKRKYLGVGLILCLIAAFWDVLKKKLPETTTPIPTTPVPTTLALATTSPLTTPAPTTAPPTTVPPTTEPPEVLKYREVVNLGEGDPREINPLQLRSIVVK